MNIQPEYKSAVSIDCSSPQKLESMYLLNLSFALADVGYPANNDQSIHNFNSLMSELVLGYLQETLAGDLGSVSLNFIHIGQEYAWVTMVASFTAGVCTMEFTLRAKGWCVLKKDFIGTSMSRVVR